MITIDIPGRGILNVRHIVLDYNGTIARDGILLDAVAKRIEQLKDDVSIYILTADTYGNVRMQCEKLGVNIRTFPQSGAAECKKRIVQELGEGVMAVGNGYNDIAMFDEAAISVAVLEEEGVCGLLLSHATVLVRSAEAALDLVLKPSRLRATLRT